MTFFSYKVLPRHTHNENKEVQELCWQDEKSRKAKRSWSDHLHPKGRWRQRNGKEADWDASCKEEEKVQQQTVKVTAQLERSHFVSSCGFRFLSLRTIMPVVVCRQSKGTRFKKNTLSKFKLLIKIKQNLF